eukprot:TRINITY_DN15034_c0_g1_i6.p1 TRINITY_DN15034_c0_g1~~TRINITY_DN15034_c0_g1_i6.p1  ORF type:complete len:335 (+),score=57.81 TRINITY_DN15034_c0_g1_i6:126-1130(+)
MIRRPPRSTHCISSAASDVYKRQLSNILYVSRTDPEISSMTEEIKLIIQSNVSDSHLDQLQPLLTINNKEYINETIHQQSKEKVEDEGTEKYLKPVDLLQDLSPSFQQSVGNLQGLFSEYRDIKEEEILEIMIFISNQTQTQEDQTQKLTNQVFNTVKKNTEDEWNKLTNEPSSDKVSTVMWNQDIFINFWNQQYPQLNWQNVMKALDKPNFNIKDEKSFINLFKFFQKMKQKRSFEYYQPLFLKPWKNAHSQIQFLFHLFKIGQIDYLCWNDCFPTKKIVNLEFNQNYKYNQLSPPVIQLWACLDLLELLINLSDCEYYVEIRQLFELSLIHI